MQKRSFLNQFSIISMLIDYSHFEHKIGYFLQKFVLRNKELFHSLNIAPSCLEFKMFRRDCEYSVVRNFPVNYPNEVPKRNSVDKHVTSQRIYSLIGKG